MTLRRWLLAGALVAAGCATTGVSDQEIARLPVQDRQEALTAQKSIDVAEQNLAAARAGRNDARQFHKIAQNELDAAKSRLDAARAGVDLGKSARDDQALRTAGRNEDLARDQMVAARAKLDYADRLVDLREAKVDESEAALDAARADVELTKVKLLQKNGIHPKVDVAAVQKRREDAQGRLADTRARVAQLEGDVAQLRQAWDDRRREFDTAWSGNTPQPLRAPAPPPELPVPALRAPRGPQGDVNTTPAAPETPQSQTPPTNIAPPP